MLFEDRRLAIFLLASSLLIIWSIRLFGVHDAFWTLLYNGSGQRPDERVFIREAMSVEFPAPIDYKPIQEVCARTDFQPGLLFSCEGQHGGVGMVRNQILRCVRYAIHGGAAIVIPSMALRNPKNLADIETSTEVPLDYLFDREAFTTRLSAGCPGLRIYEHAEDFPHYQQRVGEPLTVVGDQFEPDHPREGLKYPLEWRRYFDDWLDQQSVQVRADVPVHVHVGQSFLDYPVHADGDAFAQEFGKILSFRNDTRALAAKLLWKLEDKFGLSIDPKQAVNKNAFYGAHLRLEEDAIWAWPPEQWRFSRMEDQFEEQFQNLERTGLNVIYVASGNQTVVDLFAEGLNKRVKARSGSERRNVQVVTKHDLLQGHDRRRLDSLTFDQQALVDFLIMFKASAFMGVASSSFPWNVALRRHELSNYKKYGNEGSDLLRDEYSVIMGMQADYPEVDPFVSGIWP
ncbi:hypothetical protein BKA67DRAFT_523440 [Truncatella angustata]|uniref:Alternative oxidase n=1 Tax=Truncatella angustata TaxID=152316 RepID=A0A9P8UDF2_9PEZI|nr:uncharacterized protein BKA67DRAFT_523440 [Truncatella angustata]KAH6647797.1 hypothetical protein BKA67DRAFT_523440 [Truncatella angustata]